MADDTYFQFPLCALAFGETEYVRLNAIIDYGTIKAGLRMFQKLTIEQRREFLQGKTANRRNHNGIDPNNPCQCGALYGAHKIGVVLHDISAGIRRYEALSLHWADFVSRHGSDAFVRIKRDWVFNARDGYGLTYREFSVLCGIYSAIGDKELARVTQARIRHCSMGYRTAAIMQAELSNRADKAQPLTERQLRDTISRLHRNNFFARCTVLRRITYYSIRLNNEDFRKKVLERRTYADFFRACEAAQDQVLTDAIKRKRRECAQGAPKTLPAAPRLRFPP